MFHELATTDGVRKLNDAPSSSDIANAVTDHVSLLTQLLQQQAMETYAEAINCAYNELSESVSSTKIPHKQLC
jgi:hypothetical protein